MPSVTFRFENSSAVSAKVTSPTDQREQKSLLCNQAKPFKPDFANALAVSARDPYMPVLYFFSYNALTR